MAEPVDFPGTISREEMERIANRAIFLVDEGFRQARLVSDCLKDPIKTLTDKLPTGKLLTKDLLVHGIGMQELPLLKIQKKIFRFCDNYADAHKVKDWSRMRLLPLGSDMRALRAEFLDPDGLHANPSLLVDNDAILLDKLRRDITCDLTVLFTDALDYSKQIVDEFKLELFTPQQAAVRLEVLFKLMEHIASPVMDDLINGVNKFKAKKTATAGLPFVRDIDGLTGAIGDYL